MSNSDAMQRASSKVLERGDKSFATQDKNDPKGKPVRPEASKKDEKLSEYEANTPDTPS
jgi:hypothetical protein